MERSELDVRLAYLDLREEDLEALRGIEPLIEKHGQTIVSGFYRHLLSFEPTRDLLRDPAVKARLLDKQREYLASLVRPTLDQDFVDERRRIGEVHARIGLSPRWYLGAYALYMSLLTPLICEAHESDPRRAQHTIMALQKLLLLDAQLAMETYIEREEGQLRYLTEELAREGRELARNYEHQAAELRETAGRARAAEELASVATLVAGLAHEIGTPMGVIQGHAKLLERAVEGEDAVWRLRTIQEQITRISNIIKTLLGIARPHRMRRQPVDLPAIVESSLSFVHERLSRRGIRVESALEEVPSVVGDAERLQQLLLNLFLNAADAMPEGGSLRVSVTAREGELTLRVADTGVGMAPDVAARVFEPFYTSKPAGEGNGLGLMVAKGIVSDHGGTIQVASELGQGAEFTVRLPLPRADAGA